MTDLIITAIVVAVLGGFSLLAARLISRIKGVREFLERML